MTYIHNMKYTDTHVYFWRNNTPFSNFYRKPFTYKGYQLKFSEQGFMLEKALLFDPSMIDKIVNANQPNQAKQYGREIKHYNDRIWSNRRYQVMVDVLRIKFQDPELKEILLQTGDRIIVEASPYDKIWGVGLEENDPRILNERNWRGQNLLGKALMEVRQSLASQ